jgi:probable F420-dependent oxidoreductase
VANIGLAFVNPAPDITPDFAQRMARKTEEAGLHSFWINDRINYDNLEPLAVVSAAAAVTRRIKIGTSVLLVPLRSPVLLAKTLASIDFISGGRLILGAGLGNRRDDYDAVEIPFERRGARLAESIHLMKRLWREEKVSHSGNFFHVEDLSVGPRPVQPSIPIWLGGSADSVLRRTARLADGFMCGSSGWQNFPALWEKIASNAAGIGRNPEQIEKAALNFMVIDENRERAIAAGEAYLLRYYGRISVDVGKNMVVGSPSACAERLAAMFDKGLQTVILGMIMPDLGQIDLLAGKVLPELYGRKTA